MVAKETLVKTASNKNLRAAKKGRIQKSKGVLKAKQLDDALKKNPPKSVVLPKAAGKKRAKGKKKGKGQKKKGKKGFPQKDEAQGKIQWGFPLSAKKSYFTVTDYELGYANRVIDPNLKSALKKRQRESSAASFFQGRLEPIMHERYLTETARVKHYILKAVIAGQQWAYEFGTYICQENHPECSLPYLESDREMEQNPYYSHAVYAKSIFYMNIHKKCNLPKPVTCKIDSCAYNENKYHKSDVFLNHLEKCHGRKYTHYWQKSRYSFKPNAKQYLYGVHYAAFANEQASPVTWFCVQCRESFNRPEDWQNHRHFRKECLQQVVEILYNKSDIKPRKLWKKNGILDQEFFCAICSKDEDISEAQEVSSLSTKSKVAPSKKNKKGANFLEVDNSDRFVLEGSLRDMMNHTCERHTHKGFICLSCRRVLPLKRKKHFINCLQCTEEGMSTTEIRKYPISNQINGWANWLINAMKADGYVTIDDEKSQTSSEPK